MTYVPSLAESAPGAIATCQSMGNLRSNDPSLVFDGVAILTHTFFSRFWPLMCI